MGRRWSEEEMKFLEEKWGQISVNKISEKLNRSPQAILTKAQAMKLGGCYQSGSHYNVYEISKILNIDSHSIVDIWISRYGLKARKKKLISRSTWFILLDDLIKWLEHNQDKWNSTKLELFALGQEPDWLVEKRKKDSINTPQKHRQRWSRTQDELLMSCYRMGKKHDEIAELLGRSVKSVRRRLDKLKSAGKLNKEKVMCYWSEREEKLLKELEKQGLKDTEIAEELGREKMHIVSHRRTLKLKGLYEGRKARC